MPFGYRNYCDTTTTKHTCSHWSLSAAHTRTTVQPLRQRPHAKTNCCMHRSRVKAIQRALPSLFVH
eukprot:2959-Heterococcus_DN1.PRE.2